MRQIMHTYIFNTYFEKFATIFIFITHFCRPTSVLYYPLNDILILGNSKNPISVELMVYLMYNNPRLTYTNFTFLAIK